MDSDKVVNLLKRDADDSKTTLKKHKEIDVTRNDLDIKSEIIKKLQMNSDLLEILLKKMDDMSNRLNVVTDFVEKQQQKESDLPVTSMREEETPEVDYKCCFETADDEMINQRTIFVKGFRCSFALDEIKRKLTELFSSCGDVARVYLPYHCKTGGSIGYAYVNFRTDEKEALKLHGTRLDGICLEVTLAYGRSEYNGFPDHDGCELCYWHIKQRPREITNALPDYSNPRFKRVKRPGEITNALPDFSNPRFKRL